MSQLASRRVIVTAAAAASVALLASACGKSAPQASAPAPAATSATTVNAAPVAAPVAAAASPSPSASTPAAPQYAAGTPLISDGTDTVTIGGTPVTFPTKVSEAAWSPDGSRIAFIDGSGNVATARPDGTGVVVMVKPDQGAKLSAPAWQGGTVLYTEQNAAGTHFVRQAQAAGQRDHSDNELYVMGPDSQHDVPDTSNPTATFTTTVDENFTELVFQARGAKGSELWFHAEDSAARGGANPAEKLTDGAWPALSRDGKVAFVSTGGQIEVLAADAPTDPAKQKPAKLADGAASASHLTWTPDGRTLAYSTADGIVEIAADQPGAAPKPLSSKPGVVSFLPAAVDRVVTLSGTTPSDLVGASITVSQRNWLTQTGTTPSPAGGGPHGAHAMSVTIVAADDPAAAQKELSWGGFYGPTLLTTGHGAFDTRLSAEIKRVLGTVDKNAWYHDTDAVFLVGAPGAIPASADAAITALGYKPIRVTAAPKPDSHRIDPPAPVAIVDEGDTAATDEAKAEGCRVMTLTAGKLSASDSAYLTGADTDYSNTAPRIIAFGDKAFAAANALPLKRFALPTEALGTTHADFTAATAQSGPLTIVPSTSPTDVLLAALRTPLIGYRLDRSPSTVLVDPAQGISPTLKALLDNRSADVDQVDVMNFGSALPADMLKQISTLMSGPLGVQTVTNQTADDVAKAQPKK